MKLVLFFLHQIQLEIFQNPKGLISNFSYRRNPQFCRVQLSSKTYLNFDFKFFQVQNPGNYSYEIFKVRKSVLF